MFGPSVHYLLYALYLNIKKCILKLSRMKTDLNRKPAISCHTAGEGEGVAEGQGAREGEGRGGRGDPARGARGRTDMHFKHALELGRVRHPWLSCSC